MLHLKYIQLIAQWLNALDTMIVNREAETHSLSKLYQRKDTIFEIQNSKISDQTITQDCDNIHKIHHVLQEFLLLTVWITRTFPPTFHFCCMHYQLIVRLSRQSACSTLAACVILNTLVLCWQLQLIKGVCFQMFTEQDRKYTYEYITP
jgi:hypothetical protein